MWAICVEDDVVNVAVVNLGGVCPVARDVLRVDCTVTKSVLEGEETEHTALVTREQKCSGRVPLDGGDPFGVGAQGNGGQLAVELSVGHVGEGEIKLVQGRVYFALASEVMQAGKSLTAAQNGGHGGGVRVWTGAERAL